MLVLYKLCIVECMSPCRETCWNICPSEVLGTWAVILSRSEDGASLFSLWQHLFFLCTVLLEVTVIMKYFLSLQISQHFLFLFSFSVYHLQDTTCMGGLVLVLSNPDHSVVSLALEVGVTNTTYKCYYCY